MSAETILHADQIDAMDDTMRAAKDRADLACLQDTCGIVDRSDELRRRISIRQGLLASGPLSESARRALEDANDMDDQELCISEAEAAAKTITKDLASRLMSWVCGGAGFLLLVHLVATNWSR